MKKKILIIICFMITILMMTSCNNVNDNPDKPQDDNKDNLEEITPTNQGEAYGIVYNDYVGIVNLNVVDGIVTYITFDEAFMPMSWAVETEPNILTDVVIYDNGKKLTYNNQFSYAKYLKIDDELFTGVPYSDEELKEGSTSKQLIKYSSKNIPDLYKHLEKEENAKWYMQALKNGKAYLCDKDGKKLDVKEYNPYGSFFKSSSLYWIDGTNSWAKNIQVFSNALVGTSLGTEPTMKDGYVTFNDVSTSATLKGYMDYYQLAKTAYDRVK